MIFQYKTGKKARYTGGLKPKISTDPEALTGTLQGKAVPRDEELFYRAAMKTKPLSYFVQFEIGARGLPGNRTLDVLMNTTHGWRGIEIDGMGFVHQGTQASDKLADIQRIRGLRKLGISLPRGIEHVSDADLQNQSDADRKVRELRL